MSGGVLPMQCWIKPTDFVRWGVHTSFSQVFTDTFRPSCCLLGLWISVLAPSPWFTERVSTPLASYGWHSCWLAEGGWCLGYCCCLLLLTLSTASFDCWSHSRTWTKCSNISLQRTRQLYGVCYPSLKNYRLNGRRNVMGHWVTSDSQYIRRLFKMGSTNSASATASLMKSQHMFLCWVCFDLFI